ncbi:protein phosphatase Slingshot isoform X2 [Culex pipiens pallens]|uniref:protein phosphatase Slingshot isoform X2 n=1 Tax=Culex pipiens pallens TaxID=42434 RepID=UPI001954DBCA|nr:protein phosphatase Slingshot isoform X2 [Culex pipiens pallens]
MALVTIQRSASLAGSNTDTSCRCCCAEDVENAKVTRSLSECYFAGSGTALMLGSNEQQLRAPSGGVEAASAAITLEPAPPPPGVAAPTNPGLRLCARSDSADERDSIASSTSSTASSCASAGSDIQQHLQSMFNLLRPEETLKMAVKLESLRAGRTRYLVVVSRPPARRLRQQQLLMTTACSLTTANSSAFTSVAGSPLPAAATASASVSPLPAMIPLIGKQITSATLYKAASPSTSTVGGVGSTVDETFVSSLDNCVLSASSPKIVAATSATTIASIALPPSLLSVAAAAASASASTTTTTTTTSATSVDKCDSNKPSSTSGSPSCSVNSVASKTNVASTSVAPSDISRGRGGTGTSTPTTGSSNSSSASLRGGSQQQHQQQVLGGCCEIEESCLLGIDCNEKTTVGLVLRVLADTAIRLDGDGGFSVSSCGQQHIFKPVSVQAMWSALQTLHKVSSKAREHNFFAGGTSHEWVPYYERHITSDRSCLNEWHAMDALESRRPASPDSIRNKPTEREETERVIRTKLKEIMMTVDLDVVTSKFIRGRLEEQLDMDLGEYKSFIDEEMLVILGQMDAPTEIFDHVYLGSEWNASNLEELQRNGVRHILNVTREIDNFFPGMFDYFNVRVYDDEKTDLLKHWDNTFKYISRAKMEGSKVLVHCKMGISRSASVVIAYAMKANNWDFDQALKHVKLKRTCIKPNKNFIAQLETYQGMLDAMKNREKLQRSKSETNLKSGSGTKDGRLLPGSEPTPLIQALNRESNQNTLSKSGRFLRRRGKRPKSWSPDSEKAALLLETSRQQSHSLEHLMAAQNIEVKTIRMPCGNGQNYSVSQNQIVHLQEGSESPSASSSSVRSIISELESNKQAKETSGGSHKRKGSSSSVASATGLSLAASDEDQWDPGEELRASIPLTAASTTSQHCDTISTSTSSDTSIAQPGVVCWTSQSQIIQQIPVALPPQQPQHVSRQSSWSSVDSAVVADMIRGTLSSASRHSSWGSGDNQQQRGAPAPPSRNSSWGSYDTGSSNSAASSIQTVIEVPAGAIMMAAEEDLGQSGIFPYDKDEIPWHPGTVKRTKQKIEERSSSSIKRICSEKFGQKHPKCGDRGKSSSGGQRSNSEEALPSNRNAPGMISSTYTRLSASAPDSYCLCSYGGTAAKAKPEEMPPPKGQHRRFSFRKSSSGAGTGAANLADEKKEKNDENTAISVGGIVRNLKMSFEAKVSSDRSRKEQKKVRSLPSSPVAIHIELNKTGGGKQNPQSPQPPEDVTVRDLVGRYEAPRQHRASFNTHHRHNSTSSSASSTTGGQDQVQVVLRQRPRSVFEPLKYAQNQQKPLMISHSTALLKSSSGTDTTLADFSRMPPIPPAGAPFVRGIIIGTSNNNNNNNNNTSASTGGGTGGTGVTGQTKKVVQHHGKTHPLAKINLTKHRINATSTTAATAYNTIVRVYCYHYYTTTTTAIARYSLLARQKKKQEAKN